MTRVGLVGAGSMGRNHLRVLADLEGARLVAVCDRDPAILEAVARKHQVTTYTSWKEMFGREKLDAAVVAVPTQFHLQVARDALASGVHVLVEKPIAANLKEGRELIAAAAAARRMLAVGHIERFNPAVRELKRRLEAGELGRVFQLHSMRNGPFAPRVRDIGVVIDLATHDLDVMYQLAGSQVQRVYAETEQRIHTEHEDLLNALLKFENGAIGVLQANWLTPTKIRQLSVLGEKGLFVANYLTQELTYFQNADVELKVDAQGNVTGVSEGEMVRHPVAQAEPLRLELKSFLEAVSAGRPPEVDGKAGLRALQLAEALMASAQGGRVIAGAELSELLSTKPVG
ncbi:MAG TPA: Gfo/Idh/MocA family oxidoreductase [Candidatus Dormibacteraeota bacterium]|nr:Gfo/Idh/MocA family oxidoreductase [Candidatus Dormibacteraeota bacterium]